MVLKRIGINLLALFVGGFCGIAAARFLRDEMMCHPLVCALAIIFFLGFFLGLAHLLLLRFSRPEDQSILQPVHPQEAWAWLIPQTDGGGAGFPLNQDLITIGRDVRNRIMLPDESVSRKHAQLLRLAEGFLLRDMGSKNGTFVNGQRVQETLLRDGDLVTVGNVDLVFHLPELKKEPQETAE